MNGTLENPNSKIRNSIVFRISRFMLVCLLGFISPLTPAARASGTNVNSIHLQGWLLPYSQIITSSSPLIVTNQVFNEWYGPFPSWTNVTAFGAACDGVTDDSTAVSNALAAIGTGHCSPVLLIPGMCRVTKKPWLSQRQGVAVVGLNRDTCGFLYDGPTDAANNTNNSGASTCFHADGVVDCYFARLKFDGNFKARTGSFQQPAGRRCLRQQQSLRGLHHQELALPAASVSTAATLARVSRMKVLCGA